MFTEVDKNKTRSSTRILVLQPIEGKEAKTSKGLVDNRLWKGGNELMAVMDETNCTWRLKYKAGAVPPQIQGVYTNFTKAYNAAVEYFKSRDIEIVEVKD